MPFLLFYSTKRPKVKHLLSRCGPLSHMHREKMPNFVVTYDLNGPRPSHKQMDDLIPTLAATYASVLETVWWLDFPGTAAGLRDRLQTILGQEDFLLVIECKSAAWTRLLVDGQAFKQAFEKAA